MPDLWKPNNAKLLVATAEPFRLYVDHEHFNPPNLAQLVARGHPDTGKPFPPRDLLPTKVGVGGYAKDSARIACGQLSWGQHVWLTRSAARNQLPETERMEALSVSVLLRTKDGLYPLVKRSANVTLYPNCWDVSVAGYVGLGLAFMYGSAEFQVYIEMEEELGIMPFELRTLRQLCLMEHLTEETCNVEVCYYGETTLTGEEVLERAKHAKDSYEGKVHLFDLEGVKKKFDQLEFKPNAAATMLTLAA